MRTIKSFVLRKGRSRPRHQEALTHLLPLYQLALDPAVDAAGFRFSHVSNPRGSHVSNPRGLTTGPIPETPWCFETIFQRKAPTIIEIGFGMGHTLATMAAQNPQHNYIGIEVHQPGVACLAAHLHQHQLPNVRIVSIDACLVMAQAIADNSLQGIQIFFPDPWPKKRHHKRRLIQPDFVQLMCDKLGPGGFIHIATDWEPYAQHSLAVLSACAQLQNASPTHTFIARPESRPLTKFEARGQALGHAIFDLFFTKIILKND